MSHARLEMSKKNVVVAPVAPVAPQTRAPRDFGGNKLGTRANVVNVVLASFWQEGKFPTTAELTNAVHASTIGKEYEELHGHPVKAISNHVLYLVTSGHVARGERGTLLPLSDASKGAGAVVAPKGKPRGGKGKGAK